MTRRVRSRYQDLRASDPRWTAAVVGVWTLLGAGGLLAAALLGTAAAWCARRWVGR